MTTHIGLPARTTRWLALLVSVVALLAFACGPAATATPVATPTPTRTPAPLATPTATRAPAPTPTPTTAAQSRVLRVGLEADTQTLGPAFTGGFPDQTRYHLYTDAVIEVGPGPDFTFIPGLVDSWRLVPGDVRTWEFKLRKGIKNHDGSVLTAEDAKFYIEWQVDPANKSASKAGEFRIVEKVEVVDSETFRVTTKAADPTFYTTWHNQYLFPKRYLEQVGAAEFGKRPIGPGPYKFVSWKPDDRLVVEAFQDYYKGRPAVDQIIVFPIADPSTRVAAIRANDVDIIVKPPIEELANLKADRALTTVTYETTGILHYLVDVKAKPFDDLRVRKAIRYSIDSTGIASGVLQGLVKPFAGTNPPSMPQHNPNLKVYEFDPAKSKALLAEAGFPQGNVPIKVFVPSGRYLKDREIGEVTVNGLKQGGFAPELVVNTWPNQLQCLYTEYGTCPGGLLLMGHADYWLDGMRHFRSYYLTKLGQPLNTTRGYYYEPFEQLADKTVSEMDPAKRLEMVRELERIAWEEMLTTLQVAIRPEIVVTRANVDFKPRPVEYLYLKDAKFK